MHHEGAGHDRDHAVRCAHGATALEAEINFGGVRVTVVRADLAWLPAGDRDVASANRAEDLLDVFVRIELRLMRQVKDVHRHLPRAAPAGLSPIPARGARQLLSYSRG